MTSHPLFLNLRDGHRVSRLIHVSRRCYSIIHIASIHSLHSHSYHPSLACDPIELVSEGSSNVRYHVLRRLGTTISACIVMCRPSTEASSNDLGSKSRHVSCLIQASRRAPITCRRQRMRRMRRMRKRPSARAGSY